MAEANSIFDSSIAHFRLIEAGKPDPSGMSIDVHIISPGWGSSGYYSESALQNACKVGVYPVGMHMHIDHPTRKAEQDHPARTISGESPLAALLTEAGHYLTDGWDKTKENPSGAGVYAIAKVLPKYVEDIRAMADNIGISHYVSGKGESGTAPDGKKGKIIKELLADPMNTVDFVTVPGAGGHYRPLLAEMKVRNDPTEDRQTEQEKGMADSKQLSIRLSEIMTSDPEVIAEIRKQEREALKIDALNESQKNQLKEAGEREKNLVSEVKALKSKVAEGKARDFIAAQLKEAKIPEASGKVLTESLVNQVVLMEDGSINAAEYGKIVSEAVKAKSEEIAAILKESGTGRIRDNGGNAGNPAVDVEKAKEAYIRVLVEGGMSEEQAKKMAEA